MSMIRRLSLVFCFAPAWLSVGTAVRAVDVAAPVERHQATPVEMQRATFVVARMRAERERLRSGSFSAKVKRASGPHENKLDWKPHHVVQGEIFCAFDFEADNLRFDRQETGVAPQARGGKYIRTPEKTLHTYLGGHIADVKLPADPGSSMVKPFDVRVVGLTLPQELEEGGWSLEKTFEFLSAGQTLVSAVRQGNGRHTLTWICGKRNELERTLSVNEHNGFTPERLDLRYLDPHNEWQDLQSVRIIWKQTSEVWVPKSCSFDSREFGGAQFAQFELEFDWDSVNGVVDERLFTQQDLNLRKDTLVVDHRLGNPEIVERIGVGKMGKNGRYQRESPSKP